MKVLVGDIGGTKTLLQITELEGNHVHIYHTERFASNAWTGFTPLLEEFLSTTAVRPEKACLAVAGPVDENRARLTNLPWEDLDAISLASHFKMRSILLINDFQAIGHGIAGLTENEFATLQEGREYLHAPRALLGAGTGLGQSILVWENGSYVPLETEGGHADFSPLNEEQDRLLQFLRIRYGHVSYERLLSGAGLVNIYQFLYSSLFPAGEPLTINATIDPAAISTAALNTSDPIAVRSLHLFVRIYGQQAGNLALTCLARGGVYIAGGIAPQILSVLQNGEFIQAFRSKGRMERLLVEIPVRVVLNPHVGLLGATIVATRS